MSQTISVINRSGHAIFYTHQTSGACAGVCVCVCAIACIKWKRLHFTLFSCDIIFEKY